MNNNNLRVVLGSLRYKSAPDTNLFFQVPLIQTQREMDEYDRSITVQSEQVYNDERQLSDIFRPACKFSFLFKNKYSGTTNYTPFENNLYYINAENAASLQCVYGSTAIAWSGYPQYHEFDFVRSDYNVSGYTIPSGSTLPHIDFIPKSASSYNWNFHLSYAFDNVDRIMNVVNQNNVTQIWSASTGIPFTIERRKANGKPLVTFNCPIKHGLIVGEYIQLSFSYNNRNVYQVYSLGNDFFNTDEYVVNIIDVGFTGTTFNTGSIGTFKRLIYETNTADTISKYYVRRYKLLTNPEDALMVKAGFEQNVFGSKKKYESSGFTPNKVARVSVLEGSQSYTLSFNTDVRINDLVDNQRRPLTELYFTVLWKGYFGWTLGKDGSNNFRKLKQGWEFNIPNSGTPTNWWAYQTSESNTNFTYSEYRKTNNGVNYVFTYVNPSNEGDLIDGDFCEWNDYEQKERVISRLYHKIQYNNFVFNLNDINTGINPRGYYYQVHYPFTIRVFSDYIEEAPSNGAVGVPNYAYFSTTDNSFKWREIYSYGFIDSSGIGVNYPFINGSHYPFSTYIFRMLPEGNEYIEQTIIQQPTIDPCE